VDRKWLVPHFEKMLYDQGMLAIAYLEAFQISGDVFFREVVEEIFAFVQREMTSPEGGLYSAIDADSEGSEGKFYLWSPSEIRSLLGMEAAETVCKLFDITEEGNLEGENIPHLLLLVDSLPQPVSSETILADLIKWRSQLLAAREKRVNRSETGPDLWAVMVWHSPRVSPREAGVTGSS
jgi:uncharacterized protein YyaL (SSP411 family)